MLRKLYNTFPLFEVCLIMLAPLILVFWTVFVNPLEHSVITPDIFGCGMIVKQSGSQVVLKNDAQMQLMAIDNGGAKLGEYWSVEIQDGKYFLSLKCD